MKEFENWRNSLITEFKKNPDLILDSKVITPISKGDTSLTGFGFVNIGAPDSFGNLKDKLGNNIKSTQNPQGYVLTVVGQEGKAITDLAIDSVPLKAGRAIVLLPNMVQGKTMWVPFYVRTNNLSSDLKIRDKVQTLIEEYLNADSIEKKGSIQQKLERYVMVRTKSDNRVSPGKLELDVENNSFNVRVGDNWNTISLDNVESPATQELINGLYLNINQGLLKSDPTYIQELINSNALVTNIHNNRKLPNGQFSYFSQHTIVFEQPLIKVTEITSGLKSAKVGDKGVFWTQFKGARQDNELDREVEIEAVSNFGVKFKGDSEWTNFQPYFYFKKTNEAAPIKIDFSQFTSGAAVEDDVVLDDNEQAMLDELNDIPDDYQEDLMPIVIDEIKTLPTTQNLVVRNSTIQNAAIESIAYKLLGSTKEKVKQDFEAILSQKQNFLYSGKVTDPKVLAKLTRLTGDFEDILKNFDALSKLAIEKLGSFNIKANEAGEFENLAVDSSEDEVYTDQYNEEGNQS